MAKIADLNQLKANVEDELHSPGENGEDSQEAIDYVQQLIARMGGSGNASAPAPAVPKVAPKPVQSKSSVALKPTVSTTNSNSAQNDQLADDQLADEAERVEPKVKPQPRKATDVHSKDDMKRLREAANLTTADAFHSFSCKKIIGRAYLSFFCSVFFAITSLVIKIMGSGSANGASFKGVLVCVVISVASAAYFIRLSRIVERKVA